MHAWAIVGERRADSHDEVITAGWHPDVSPYLASVSAAMAVAEAGRPVPVRLVREMEPTAPTVESVDEWEALMADDIHQFLLVFTRAGRVREEVREFGTDTEAALAAYADAERTYRDSDWMPVVLIGSDSLETVRITHANYFPQRY